MIVNRFSRCCGTRTTGFDGHGVYVMARSLEPVGMSMRQTSAARPTST